MAVQHIKLRYLTEEQISQLFSKYQLSTKNYMQLLPKIYITDISVQKLTTIQRLPKVGDLVIEDIADIDENLYLTPYVISESPKKQKSI